MRLQAESISKVALTDVLKRRRTSLKRYLDENGIVTYELLVSRCKSMGFVPPSQELFAEVTGKGVDSAPDISSPTEGVIVLDPPTIISEKTGEPIETLDASASTDDEVAESTGDAEAPVVSTKKKPKNKTI